MPNYIFTTWSQYKVENAKHCQFVIKHNKCGKIQVQMDQNDLFYCRNQIVHYYRVMKSSEKNHNNHTMVEGFPKDLERFKTNEQNTQNIFDIFKVVRYLLVCLQYLSVSLS